ncbi:D-alanine--D-alanine ligase [Paenibacillus glycanilyticus]|uniref:D-alanine--D-alanine ligase n=1 Tax=Paenibacillus glycanilyticus TaxID=126569 RepID=A0ABQ6NM17_9BACL|nr:D-alanine--D-alanine ligase [Paenibacillus glycanilyticus]GMK45804.1 D-alanine--D-alanine ligase [Paenibacillus glycanilyticus]
MGQKVHLGLIYGGKSGEHDVSLRTAFAVMGELDYAKYEITPFYITRLGEWRVGSMLGGQPGDIDELRLEPVDGAPVPVVPDLPLAPLLDRLAGGTLAGGGQPIDVVFPLLHGTFGEDGTIQGLLEIADIPYVGAGVLASAAGMDKITMKKIFAYEGLPQCVFRYFNRAQWEKDASFFIMECEVALGYPCFVKPSNLGSSVGISKAKTREELIAAIDFAFRFDRRVIVEEFVDAREIEVSVLGNDDPKISVPGEIAPSNEFYDYKAKYVDGKSTIHIPANIPNKTAEAVRDMALRAFLAIDGSGLSRVDFFLRKTDGQLFVNEVNTMPGFTPISMYPLMWKESGLPYKDLLDKLIDLAFKRYADRKTIDFGGSGGN